MNSMKKKNKLKINPHNLEIIKHPNGALSKTIKNIVSKTYPEDSPAALFTYLTILLCADDNGELVIEGKKPEEEIYDFIKENRRLLNKITKDLLNTIYFD